MRASVNIIPWHEQAIVVRQRDDDRSEREEVRSGSLHQVTEWIETSGLGHDRLTVSLPDRRVPPYRFDASRIAELIVLRKQGDEARRDGRRKTLGLF